MPNRTNPSHAVLAVVLQVRDGVLQVLLWRRAREPFAGAWALPGGALEPGETLEASIRRQLAQKVDVRELAHLEQLETHASPVPDALATAYLGLVPADVDPAVPGDTAWHAVDDLPELAFDHGAIVLAGRGALARKALVHERRLRARAARRSRSRSCATSTAPRSATTSRRRTSSACCCAAACSSRRASAAVPAARAAGRRRSSASARRDLEITDQFAVLRPPG